METHVFEKLFAPSRMHARGVSRDGALAPLIALVGSDGSGKSTVGNALLAALRETRPVAMCHLGKQTGDFKRALYRLPLVGNRVGGTVKAKSDQVSDEHGAGALTALVTYHLSMRRLRRFRRMMALRRRGVTVIADRYPQLAIPGPKMDGPHLVVADPTNRITRFLTARERQHYRWMTSYLPDLVIRLNVDFDTALARKPDHSRSGLKRKIEIVPSLSYNGAPIIDIDSCLPLEQVIETARNAVFEALAQRPRHFVGAVAQPGNYGKPPSPSSLSSAG